MCNIRFLLLLLIRKYDNASVETERRKHVITHYVLNVNDSVIFKSEREREKKKDANTVSLWNNTKTKFGSDWIYFLLLPFVGTYVWHELLQNYASQDIGGDGTKVRGCWMCHSGVAPEKTCQSIFWKPIPLRWGLLQGRGNGPPSHAQGSELSKATCLQ